MIRVRDKDGKLLPLPEGATFIEVCSSDGKIGSVLFMGDAGTNLFDTDEPEAKIYSKQFNVEFVNKVIDLGKRYEDV